MQTLAVWLLLLLLLWLFWFVVRKPASGGQQQTRYYNEMFNEYDTLWSNLAQRGSNEIVAKSDLG
jgi:predicted PurR-regulated permease PerM